MKISILYSIQAYIHTYIHINEYERRQEKMKLPRDKKIIMKDCTVHFTEPHCSIKKNDAAKIYIPYFLN